MKKLKMHSPDLCDENITLIRALFPGCVTEAIGKDGSMILAVDFDQLRQELREKIVEGPQERYQLNWPGKREALLAANAPVAKLLRPNRNDSVDFDSTKNLFIEGDNLDALKLLQETYLGKVKMIYIDPPYNTGNDFIYADDFSDAVDSYLRRSNQKDEEGKRLIANTVSNGRFHSDWLSMMYSRLRLARNLLSEEGAIFISLDDGEFANLRKLCDEIFGEDKFIASLIWKSRQNKDNRTKNGVSIDHEYVLVYGKSVRGADRDLTGYSNPDGDTRGDWTSANMVGLATADRRPNLHYDLVDPATGINYGCPPMGWRYDRNTMANLISEKRILWPANPDGRPRKKSFVAELGSERTGFSSIIGKDLYTRNGTSDIEALFGRRVMDFPKPVSLLEELITQANVGDDEIVLDFFSGSATTAHAVLKLNAADGKRRRFVMVQIPEQCDEGIIEHLAYDPVEDKFDLDIFTAGQTKQDFSNAVKTPKHHIYDYVLPDSGSRPEREFAEALEASAEVVVYAKLPRGFLIPTPVGDYNPDWAITFKEGSVKHIYFVAETKGTMLSMELREIEKTKINCARKFFDEMNRRHAPENVKYDVVDSFGRLMEIVS